MDTKIELAENLLFDFGATAVTLEDAEDVPQLEPKPGEILPWPKNILTAWFTPDTALDGIIEQIGQVFPNTTVKQQSITEADWQQNLHAGFKSLHFGERLSICPSWETIEETGRTILHLDPGLAFGTGSHPTTGMCLTWLSNHIKPHHTVLDYGCGSGILSLAALKLGANQVWAIDYDPQAVQSTLNNAEKNQISLSQLNVGLPEDAIHIPTVSVIVANILAGPLVELAPRFRQFSHIGTQLILSGILAHQANEVKAAYAPWFTFISETQEEDWVCLVANYKSDKD